MDCCVDDCVEPGILQTCLSQTLTITDTYYNRVNYTHKSCMYVGLCTQQAKTIVYNYVMIESGHCTY